MKFYSESGDGVIEGEHAVYATARSTSTQCATNPDTAIVGQVLSGNYWASRAFLVFDTSAIPNDAIIEKVTLYVNASTDNSDTNFLVQVYRYAWVEALCSNREANYDGVYGAGILEGTLRDTSDGWVPGTYYSLEVATAGVNKSGKTKYCLASKEDVDNSAPVGPEFVLINLEAASGTGREYDPYLEVIFSSAQETWINVYDTSSNLQARLLEFADLTYTLRSNKPGALKMTIHQDATGTEQLTNGKWVEVYRDGQTVWSGIINRIERVFDENGDPTRYYEILARDFNWLPYWRVIVPGSGDDYLVKAGSKVDDAVKYMVRKQMEVGEVDNADRGMAGFTVEGDETTHGDTKTLAARYQDNLGTMLEKWAAAYDFDWWVDADIPAGTFIFRTKVPRRGGDKSASVIFSVNRHNILSLEYWQDDLSTGSLCYVGGPGQGATQTVNIRPAAEPTGWDRREVFVAAADAEYSDELNVAGDAWLASFGDVLEGVRFRLNKTDACRWKQEFDIGDKVTAYDADWSIDKAVEIKEITITIDENEQETIDLIVGEPQPSQWEQLLAGIGAFTSFDDNSDPDTPTNPSDTVATVTDDRGNQTGSLRLNWNDNSELDLSGYQVEVLRTGEAKWKTQRVTASEAVFEGFPLGSSVTARVKARDNAGNESAYLSFGGAITMPTDTTAPALTTNPPTVTAVKKGVHIKITRPTEQDWAYTEFYCDTNNPPTTLVKSGRSTVCTFKTANYTLHYARYKLYDEAGNDSAYSNVGSATPEKVEGAGGDGDIGAGTIDTADITNLAVETAKINSLAVTTAKIDALAVTNAKINDLAAGKITAGSLNVTVLLEAASIKAGTISAAIGISSAGTISFVDGPSWYGSGGNMITLGTVEIGGQIVVVGLLESDTGLEINTVGVLDSSRNLTNVTIDVATVGVSGNWDIGANEFRADTIKSDGFLAMADGMAIPAATAGYAKLYVDSANGDLYIRFGDGTIKLIMVD